ncbi:MAG TPA: alpha-L-arabinofuranosidase C-terminal domain-containing protein, partial [Opitutaceae bacterium]|nr:alpha-L-arabinofuranosidase C-terminal domain-containing protein [Opitutaceae bacterium]
QSRPIAIAITEWGPLFGSLPDWIDHYKTMGSAVYAGRVMQVLLSHPKVKIANYFKFFDGTPVGWNSYLNRPKADYYIIQLFALHFGTSMVATSVTSPTYSTSAVGDVPAETNVAEVTAVSSVDPVAKKLFINFVNRAWSQTHYVRLKIYGFNHTTTSGTLWQVYSPNVTDNNGPDVTPGLNLSYVDPSTTVSNIQIQSKTVSLGSNLALPPHSVETLEIDGN